MQVGDNKHTEDQSNMIREWSDKNNVKNTANSEHSNLGDKAFTKQIMKGLKNLNNKSTIVPPQF